MLSATFIFDVVDGIFLSFTTTNKMLNLSRRHSFLPSPFNGHGDRTIAHGIHKSSQCKGCQHIKDRMLF